MDRIGTTTVVKNAFPLAPTVQRVADSRGSQSFCQACMHKRRIFGRHYCDVKKTKR